MQLSSTGGAILKTTVRDLIARDPIGVDARVSVRDAARLMSTERVSALLVTRDGRLAGILTDRDLRTRVLAVDVDPATPSPTS